MKKPKIVDLKQILAQCFMIAEESESFKTLGLNDEQMLYAVTLTAMKEACEQAIVLSAKNAETKRIMRHNVYDDLIYTTIIDRKSILNTKKQII
jgi:hypothetical protein